MYYEEWEKALEKRLILQLNTTWISITPEVSRERSESA